MFFFCTGRVLQILLHRWWWWWWRRDADLQRLFAGSGGSVSDLPAVASAVRTSSRGGGQLIDEAIRLVGRSGRRWPSTESRHRAAQHHRQPSVAVALFPQRQRRRFRRHGSAVEQGVAERNCQPTFSQSVCLQENSPTNQLAVSQVADSVAYPGICLGGALLKA